MSTSASGDAPAEPRRGKGKHKNMNKPWEDDSVDHWEVRRAVVRPAARYGARTPLTRASTGCGRAGGRI